MSDINQFLLGNLELIYECWLQHECMDRMIFPENFTENEEIKEQILFYRAMRNAKKKVYFNDRTNESDMFYKSVAFYLNKYTQPEHQLFTMLPISAMTLREMTAAYIENNPCELVEFKELIDSDPHYCQKIRENEVWKEETERVSKQLINSKSQSILNNYDWNSHLQTLKDFIDLSNNNESNKTNSMVVSTNQKLQPKSFSFSRLTQNLRAVKDIINQNLVKIKLSETMLNSRDAVSLLSLNYSIHNKVIYYYYYYY